jgi:hypothetical protein
VLSTHFPVSAYLGSALFILLQHLVTQHTCFELAAFVAVITGTIVRIPTILTGWFTWKGRFRGASTRIFQNKIRISFTTITISPALTIWKSYFTQPPFRI